MANGTQGNPNIPLHSNMRRVQEEHWHGAEVHEPHLLSDGSNQNWKLFSLLLVFFLSPVIRNRFISPGREVLDNDWMEFKKSTTVYWGNLNLEFKIIKYQKKRKEKKRKSLTMHQVQKQRREKGLVD